MARPSAPLIDCPVWGVDRVVDGDTVHLWVQTSRDGLEWQNIRLIDFVRGDELDAPETREPGGRQATTFVHGWLLGRRLRVTTRGVDSFGRLLGDIYDAQTGEHLDVALIAYMRELGYTIIYPRP